MTRTFLVAVVALTVAAPAAALPIIIEGIQQQYDGAVLNDFPMSAGCADVLFASGGGTCSIVLPAFDPDHPEYLYLYLVANPVGAQNELFQLDARLPPDAFFWSHDYTRAPIHPYVFDHPPIGIYDHAFLGRLGGSSELVSMVWFETQQPPRSTTASTVFSTGAGDVTTITNDVFAPSVPEPTLLLLLAGGVLATCRNRRRTTTR